MASSTSLKTTDSNLHHSTTTTKNERERERKKRKRHQNLVTISCHQILKIHLLWHSMPYSYYCDELLPYAMPIYHPLKRVWHSFTRNFLHHRHLQLSSVTHELTRPSKDFVAAEGTELHGTIKLKQKQKKCRKTISSVKLASERLINSSVLRSFLS